MNKNYNHICPVILAAGKGTRMGNKDLPKTLNVVGGKTIIDHSLHGLSQSIIGTKPLLVIGHRGGLIRKYLKDRADYVVQEKLLGTGQAVACACEHLGNKYSHLLVLNGDHPFIFPEIVNKIVNTHLDKDHAVTITTTKIDPANKEHEHLHSYGRVIKKRQKIAGIVEAKDATPEEKEIREVNVGFYCFKTSWLRTNVNRLHNQNAQGEYYLTDLVSIAVSQNKKVGAVEVDMISSIGINTKEQLLRAEKIIKERVLKN